MDKAKEEGVDALLLAAGMGSNRSPGTSGGGRDGGGGGRGGGRDAKGGGRREGEKGRHSSSSSTHGRMVPTMMMRPHGGRGPPTSTYSILSFLSENFDLCFLIRI